MKLNADYITHTTADEQIMVATGESTRRFSGLVRSNATAAAIVELLGSDTTEEKIVDALLARYDAPREVIARDVADILKKLRSIGALAE